MSDTRISIGDFSLANQIYSGARVTFWTIDNAGAKTTTAATLYAAPTGLTTLANPQTLDRDGKLTAPVYINTPVIATIAGRRIDSHDTGIIGTVFLSGYSLAGGTAGQVPIIGSGGSATWRTFSGAFTVNEFGVATLTTLAASNLSNGTTGTGNVVLKNSPTLVTPALGVATATSINGMTITTTTGTITLTNGKTLSVNNSITLVGTDGHTYTFPAGGTVLTADSTATLTNKTFSTSGAGNSLQVSGVAISRGQFPGTSTNDSATTGNIGECIKAYSPFVGPTTVTITIAAPGVITWANHRIVGVTAVYFTTTGGLPTGLVASTTYYTLASTNGGNTFSVASSIANALANTPITTSGAQSGTHTGNQAVALTTATPANIAAITLTAGDWDIDACCYMAAAATTVTQSRFVSVSTASATLSLLTGQFGGGILDATGHTQASSDVIVPTQRVSISSTTTYYLVAQAGFNTSTFFANGASLSARRMR